jgi:acyl-CoA synthetase (AMP-forming)/AMP-acid ligase II
MVRDLLQADPERYNLSSLETLVYGTAPMPLAVARELTARIPCGLINGYGLTESCAMATALGADAHRQAIEKNDDATLGSVGWPVPGIEVAILDPRQQDLPTGSGGEIALRGAKLSSGYLRDGEQTESHFLPTGWLLTGDRGCLSEDGRLTLQGRMDDMIISGGLNIQPAEVEEKALQYGGVAACAAFGIPSERWGQELHLAVTPAAGETLDPDLITAFLRTRVDRYKVPKAVHIVDALPVTGIGKIQRARLRERAMRGEI